MEPLYESGPPPEIPPKAQPAHRSPINILDGMLAAAVKLHYAGRLPDAERAYRRILSLDSEHPPTLCRLGMLAQQVGNLDVAAQLLDAAVRNAPAVAFHHARLGEVLQAQGRSHQAEFCFQRARELEPCLAAPEIKLPALRQNPPSTPANGLEIA